MKISITTEVVFKYAISLTARTGYATGKYDSVAATEDNIPMMQEFLSAAINEAEGKLKRKLGSSNDINLSVSQSEISLELKDFVRFETAILDFMKTNLRLYAANYLAATWLDTTSAAEASKGYLQSAASYLEILLQAINQRESYVVQESEYGDRRETDAEFPVNSGSGSSSEFGDRNTGDTETVPGTEGMIEFGDRNIGEVNMSANAKPGTEYNLRVADTLFAHPNTCTDINALTDKENNPIVDPLGNLLINR